MNKKQRKESVKFLTGVGITAFCIGFMIGASSTPIVAVIVPTIFGLVTGSLGLLQEKKASEMTEFDKYNSFESTTKKDEIGQFLILFSLSYMAGLGMGIAARVGEWQRVFLSKGNGVDMVENPTKTFPWEGLYEPGNMEKIGSNFADALNWICLQEKLLEIGYTPEQIKSLQQMPLRLDAYDMYPGGNPFYMYCFGSSAASEPNTSPSPSSSEAPAPPIAPLLPYPPKP